jgi:hypothetical protein
MTVYLYCEGNTDYASLPPIMHKFDETLNIKRISKTDAKKIALRKSGFKITGAYKMIHSLAAIARRDGCKHIVYHQDADRDYDNRYKTIEETFQPMRNSGMKCLAIVPKEMTESWLLADRKAFTGLDTTEKFPSEPEELWGDKNNPQGSHPKRLFEWLTGQCNMELDTAYAHIAVNADVEVLRKQCPRSFGQFWVDMQGFVG